MSFRLCLVWVELIGFVFASNYPANVSINNTKWLDTEGNFIHAHGGEIYEYNNTFYWIGTTEKQYFNISDSYYNNSWLSEGINCYSSDNLMDWKFENKILENTSIIITNNNNVSPPWRIEKPKILYNEKNNNFILWFHVDNAQFSLNSVGLAKSNNKICDKYEWIDSFQPDGLGSFDMSLYQNKQQNIAYLMRNVNNQYIGISELNDNYTNTSSDGIIAKGPSNLEGSTIFLLSTYYLMGSHMTWWNPNPAQLCTSNATVNDTLVNIEWNKQCPNPTNSSISYNSQITTVVRFIDEINNKYTFMYMSDIWNYPNLTLATYLWLPIDFKGNNSFEAFPSIPYLKNWKVKDYSIPIP